MGFRYVRGRLTVLILLMATQIVLAMNLKNPHLAGMLCWVLGAFTGVMAFHTGMLSARREAEDAR